MSATYYIPVGMTYFGAATANYTTYDHVFANDAAATIYGYYSGSMIITGGAGADYMYLSSSVTGGSMFGGAGNDTMDASGVPSGSFYLDGGSGNDTIIGGGTFDILTGNGSDSMTGSNVTNAVNEFYDLFNGGDTLTGGLNASNYFHISGGSDKVIGGNKGDQYYINNYGYNTITGGSGADVFYDSSYSNTITTGNGNDTVWAAATSGDKITGGSGNNSYHIGGTSTSAVTQLTAGSGNDTIDASGGFGVIYAQPGTGSGVNVFTGDDYSNHVYGQFNSGSLYMRGGKGTDELTGGHGANTFIGSGGGDFVTAGGTANAFDFNSLDEGNLHINNFNVNTDHFGIYADGFKGILTGGQTLTAGYNLINGTASVANTSTFLYSNGLLSYDPDGTGSAGATLLAGLSGSVPATITANNIQISTTKF